MNQDLLLKAVGDIAPGDFTINGVGVFSTAQRYGAGFLFEEIEPQLSGADILVGNLEDVLSVRCRQGTLRHCGHPEMAKVLRNIGFNVLSVANNHVFDHGPEFFWETVTYCRDAGIDVCGLRGNNGYFCKPVILKKKGYRVGFLAYNWIGLEREDIDEFRENVAVIEDGVVNYSLTRNPSAGKASMGNVEKQNRRVFSDIAKLRKEVDVLVMLPHWGYEWTIYPPYGLTVEARSFVDAGVDVIIGSHSHVPQGIEQYNNSLIAYSLGNFLFDGFAAVCRYGMIVEIRVNEKKVEDYGLSFVRRSDKFQPEPASQEEDKKNRALIDKSSTAIISAHAEHLLNDEKIFQEFVRQYKKLKYQKIVHLVGLLPRYPFLFRAFMDKVGTFFHVLLLNIKGRRVRW